MCLNSILDKEEQARMLEKVADPMVCWKTVEMRDGKLRPLHLHITTISYHAGVNVIPQHVQNVGYSWTKGAINGGAHFFKCRADADAAARHTSNRRVIRCLIAKKDIDIVGYTPMHVYLGYSYNQTALTIVAHRATFAKTIREVS